MLYGSRNFTIHLVISVLLSMTMYGLLVAALWSFNQTRLFIGAATDAALAVPGAMIVQFGQNVTLVARNTVRDDNQEHKNQRVMLMIIFVVLCFIDALTNYGQWFIEHANPVVKDLPSLFAYITGLFFCGSVVFVEEALAFVGALTLHSWNNVLKGTGHSGIKLLDMAAWRVSQAGLAPEKQQSDGQKKQDHDQKKQSNNSGAASHNDPRRNGREEEVIRARDIWPNDPPIRLK